MSDTKHERDHNELGVAITGPPWSTGGVTLARGTLSSRRGRSWCGTPRHYTSLTLTSHARPRLTCLDLPLTNPN